MNKKDILVGGAFVLLVSFSIFVIATSETIIVNVGDINTTASSQDVEVPIFLENNVTIYGIDITLPHSDDLILKNVSLGERLIDSIIEFNDVEGDILIAAVSFEGIAPGNDTILNLVFDISSSASGEYSLNATNIEITSIDTNFYETNFVPGIVYIN